MTNLEEDKGEDGSSWVLKFVKMDLGSLDMMHDGSDFGICSGKSKRFGDEIGCGTKKERIHVSRPSESHIHSHMNCSRKDLTTISKSAYQ